MRDIIINQITVKHNIYDRHGRIYITKGTAILLDNIHKTLFKRIGVWDQIQWSIDSNSTEKSVYDDFKNELVKMKQRYKGINEKAFNQAATQVYETIFEDQF